MDAAPPARGKLLDERSMDVTYDAGMDTLTVIVKEDIRLAESEPAGAGADRPC